MLHRHSHALSYWPSARRNPRLRLELHVSTLELVAIDAFQKCTLSYERARGLTWKVHSSHCRIKQHAALRPSHRRVTATRPLRAPRRSSRARRGRTAAQLHHSRVQTRCSLAFPRTRALIPAVKSPH